MKIERERETKRKFQMHADRIVYAKIGDLQYAVCVYSKQKYNDFLYNDIRIRRFSILISDQLL